MLGGRPLISHTIDCAKQCRVLDRIVVSTDDEEIAAVARGDGAEIPFLRPRALAEDNTSKWLVFRHLVEQYEQMHGVTVRILADLDTGVPLRNADDVDGCIRRLEQSDADVVVTAYASERNPYFNMVERGPHGYMQPVKLVSPPVVARQLAPPVFSLSPGVFAIRRDALWGYEHWSQAKLDIFPVPQERAIDIDSETDFTLVECLMARVKND
jgi:N-acylneuraminate cytidylyltransferase/CMP-N,N'-diacetyllegionaminic acid synthase